LIVAPAKSFEIGQFRFAPSAKPAEFRGVDSRYLRLAIEVDPRDRETAPQLLHEFPPSWRSFMNRAGPAEGKSGPGGRLSADHVLSVVRTLR
jgi:hypothetical protein